MRSLLLLLQSDAVVDFLLDLGLFSRLGCDVLSPEQLPAGVALDDWVCTRGKLEHLVHAVLAQLMATVCVQERLPIVVADGTPKVRPKLSGFYCLLRRHLSSLQDPTFPRT